MSTSTATTALADGPSATEARFWRWGRLVLGAALGFGLLLVLLIAWKAPDLMGFVPFVLGAGAAGFFASQSFPRSLYLVLAGFVLITAHEAGLQPEELLYGLVYLSFLAYWYVSRVFFYRDALLETPIDWAVFVFLAYAAGSVGLSLVFGMNVGGYVGEALVVSMLAFYFPVKEACRNHPDGARHILWIIGWLAAFTAVRNLFNFREVLAQATYAWQVTDGRVPLNEILLMMGSLMALTLLIHARQWRTWGLLLGTFLLFFAGLIITQSRGYWASFLFGAGILFLLVDRRRKAGLLLLAVGGITGTLAVGTLLYEDFITLLVVGVVDRLATLGTAATADISLINRFYESASVWEYIKQNPVLGYGMGVKYKYYNIIYKVTRDWSFIHNGYLGLWYKFGLVGLGSALVFWLGSAWYGIRLFRLSHIPRTVWLAGLVAAVCLLGELLVANTSNPFIIEDGVMMFGILMGLVSGCWVRHGMSNRNGMAIDH